MTAHNVSTKAIEAERLLSLVMATKVAELLEALSETGVLENLATAPADVDAMAAELGLDPYFLDVAVCHAARLGFLTDKSGGKYALSEAAQEVTSMLDLEMVSSHWHRKNGSLVKVLRTGDRQDPLDDPDIDTLRPVYDEAMRNSVRLLALNIARSLPKTPNSLVVDLGGGDGSLAVELYERTSVRVVVVDRASTRTAFDRRMPEAIREKIRFRSIDLRVLEGLSELATEADMIVMSNIVHLLNPSERTALWEVLAGSGPLRVLVYDQFPMDAKKEDAPIKSTYGLPRLGDLMVIDWLRCGVHFDCADRQLADEAEEFGLQLERIASPYGLPGRMVILRAI